MRGNGDGSVYQSRSLRRHRRPFCAVITVGLDEKRRPIRVARFASSEEAAWDELVKLRREYHLGVDPNAVRQLLRDFLADWLAGVAPRLAPRTVTSYRGTIDLHLAPALGSVQIGKLRPGDIRRMIAGHGGSARTVTLSLVVLRMALRQAIDDGILDRDPSAGVRPPRPSPRETRLLSVAEARRLLAATEDDRLGPLWAIALATGARQGELLGLRWSDVDLATGRLTIRHALAHERPPDAEPDDPTEAVLVRPKTRGSRRALVLPAFAHAALRRQKARQAAEQLAAGDRWRDRGHVFTRADGEVLWGSYVTRALARALVGAGLPVVTFHSLRHFAATELVARTGDLKMAQTVLGHSAIGVTADVYAHGSEAALERAAGVMDEALGGKG